MVPLSNVFECTIHCAACARSAVPCTYTGTLPGPTPSVGVPDVWASSTSDDVPVARIMATSGWAIIAVRYSFWPWRMHWRACAGAPARSAAADRIRTVSFTHFRAARCGLTMSELRVLRQMSALKIVVAVGLVSGTVARMGPFGCAICVMPRSSSSAIAPTVFDRRMSS